MTNRTSSIELSTSVQKSEVKINIQSKDIEKGEIWGTETNTDGTLGIKEEPILTTILSPNGQPVVISSVNVDMAMKLAQESMDLQITKEEDTRLRWKIDFCMFPLMCLLYAVQFMDKISTGSAAVMGLRTDLKMHGDQYSWVGSAFYFGYLFMNMGPVQFIFQRSDKMAKMLALFVIIWGVLLSLHSVPSVNYASFIALRVLLGCAESVVTPCFTIITAQYWKTEEQFTRVCIWFGMNGLGSIILSAIAYGVYIHEDSYSIKAWRLLFIITGVITIFVGFLIYFWIPDDPSKARFLSKREKLMVVERIRSNQQGFGNQQIKKYQIIEALKDVRTWLYFLFTVSSNIPNGGISNFLSILLNSDFGFSTKDTFLLSIPTGAVELVGCPLFGILALYAANKKVPIWKYKLAFLGNFFSCFGINCKLYAGFCQWIQEGKISWCISLVHFTCFLYLCYF